MTKINQASPTFIEKIDIIPAAALLAAIITWFWHQALVTGRNIPAISLWAIVGALIVLAIVITHSQRLGKNAKQKWLSFIAHFGAWLPISAILWQFYYWDHLNGRWAQEVYIFYRQNGDHDFVSLPCRYALYDNVWLERD